jgi:hypothetical protein
MALPAVQQALRNHPEISGKALSEQFDKMLLRPLHSLESLDRPTVVLVIDALDECDDDANILTIIRLLPQLQSIDALCIRIFLTSRPELPIKLGFSRIMGQHQDFVLHEVPKVEIEHDISLFLEHKVAKIREDHGLPDDWSGKETIRKLVELSVPLFIFAATTCRLLEDEPWSLAEVLTDILIYGNESSKSIGTYQLRGTYLPVLKRFLRRESKRQESQLINEFRLIIGSIILLESPLSVSAISELLDLHVEKIKWRLRPFHSVLNVPDEESAPVRLFHLSFREFLLDSEISDRTPLWIEESSTHQKLSDQCMFVCRQKLKKNICGLASGIEREEIDAMDIQELLSPALQYSCRYWVHHLVCSKKADVQNVHLFLKGCFLYWMEAMGILGRASQVIRDLNLLQSTFDVSPFCVTSSDGSFC